MELTGPQGSIAASFSGKRGAFSIEVEFEVPIHGITALFGPSGCGKTTILRCLVGLERLSGYCRVAGETWQESAQGIFIPTHKRPVGYVFQEASLFPHLSVRDNLLFGVRRAANRPGNSQNFDAVCALLGLGALLEREPSALSGGERSRVAIGRALLSQPRLLLMDEPLTGLDSATKQEILPYLETLHRELSVPIIYVSHDIAEVAQLADHMIVLAGGKRIAAGTTAEMLERFDLEPVSDPFEAGVILTARVVGHEQAFHMTHLDHFGHSIVIPAVNVPLGSEVRLRIRARDVSLATQRPENISIRNILSGTIVGIAAEADSAYAEVLIDLGHARLRSRLTRASVFQLQLQTGMPVYALVKSVTFDGRPVQAPVTCTRPPFI